MYNTITLHRKPNDTFDVLIYCSSEVSVEFGLDFLSSKKFKVTVDNAVEFIKKNSQKIKIDAVKVLVGTVVVATMPFASFMNVYGAEQGKYSMAYIYTGTSIQQMSYVDRTNGALSTVSPSYFNIQSDGSLALSGISTDFINHAHSQGVKVIPFLSNSWDRQAGINALNNADALSTQIANCINQYNLDGVNIDIENVTELQRDQYTNFVSLLRAKIPSTKEVSVAVAANPNGWLTGWHGSYDYTNLANNSDYLMMMAYDEHWQGSTPGPVASISFVENSIKYAISKTDGSKIVLGLPFYGRIWSQDNNFNGNGVTLEKINQLVQEYGGTVTYDSVQQAPQAVFTVTSGSPVDSINGKTLLPGTYTVWYENEASIQAKLALVNKYNLKGTGIWAIGQEPSTIWQNYSTWLNNTDTTSGTVVVTPITKVGVVSATVLNLRSAPSATSSIVATINQGTNVNITGTTNTGWYTIKLSNGQTGYVSAAYISDVPVQVPTRTGSVNTSVLNVRTSPSTTSKILTTINRGSTVSITGTPSSGWYSVKLPNGQSGYVSSTYISETNANATTPTPPVTTKVGVVNTAILNARSDPSTRARILTTLRKGANVTIKSTANGWYNVTLPDGRNAYVSTSYVTIKNTTSTPTTTTTQTTTKTGVVNVSQGLNLRSTASTSGKIIRVLPKGATFTITSTRSGWYGVRLSNGQTGYVSSSYVSIR